MLDLWRKVVAYVSNLLVLAGLGFIAYGVFYWWRGYPYAVAILMFCLAFGLLGLGAGLSLRRPATTTTLTIAAVSLAVAGPLLMYVTPPVQPLTMLLVLFCGAGALENYRRLRQQRPTPRR